MLLEILAAAAVAAPAELPPKTVSPLVVTGQLKHAPPADADVKVDTTDDVDNPFGVSFYSTKAWQKGLSGHVTLTCLIDVHGLAERCRVAFEDPRGLGFGAAALQMQPLLKIKPKIGPDGQPIAADMNIALTFDRPPPDNNLQDFMAASARYHLAHGDPELGVSPLQLHSAHNATDMRPIVMMNHPRWVAAPSFDDLAGVYPAGAGETEGFADIHCEVRRSGELFRCFVARQQPNGWAWGEAAMKLAARFRVSAEAMRYAPSNGGPIEVDIPVRFPPRRELAARAVTAPSWVAGVDPEAAPKLFPPEAAAKGLTSGRGVARCTVAADGSLGACAAEPGDPDGLGFSEAAMKLAGTLRLNLWSADDQPVVGGVVRVPIRLNLQAGG